MHSDLVKASAIVLLSFGCWLLPLTLKFSKIEQGLSLVAALCFSLELIRFSQEMEEKESIIRAERAMQRQLIETEITLETFQKEMQLADQYSEKQPLPESLPPTSASLPITSHPEVTPEDVSRLEALWKLDGSNFPSTSNFPEVTENSISTTDFPSAEVEVAKALYREIRTSLKEGKSATWIVENILKMKGRKFHEGKERLTYLLQLGTEQDW